MRLAGINPRGGAGFPWTYGPGVPALPAATRHGVTPPPPTSLYQADFQQFRLILTGNPYNDQRPRGPWVAGSHWLPSGRSAQGFPLPAATGYRLPGGVGTDLFAQETWQRQYRFTPP